LSIILFQSVPISQLLLPQTIVDDPFSAFNFIFDDAYFNTVAEETNRYYEQTKGKLKYNRNWDNVSPNEIRAFFRVLLLMCINKRASIYDHFSDIFLLSSKVKEILNRTKFWLIWKYLHLHNNETQQSQVVN